MVTLARELVLPRWAVLAWWRLHERDSGTAPDMYGAPASYPYGKVEGLSPDLRVITETGETPFVCCGYCAAHMAAWTAEEGLSESMFDEAHAIRTAAGRPHNNGSNASELRTGAARALGVTLEAVAVSEIPGQLQAGYAVAASCQYADLPDYLRVQSNDFGHGVTLYGWKDGMAGYFDPLWPQGNAGAWARWGDLTPALWSDGNHSTTVERWGPYPGETDMPMTAADGLTSSIRAECPAGLYWYEDANLTRQGGHFSKLSTVVYVGAPIGETAPGGSRAVLINTGNLYGDGSIRPSVVYVAADAVRTYSVPPPGPSDEAEIIALRDAQWRESIVTVLEPGPFE